jgi:hypothetical protein
MKRLAVVVAGVICSAVADAADAGEVFLRASQIGYRLDDPKTAVAFAHDDFDGRFLVVEAASGKTVLEANGKSPAVAVWGKFARHVEIDFSALRRPGQFRLAVGPSRSPVFHIGDDVFWTLPDALLEFMRQQRCGYNPWLDVECHPHDGRTAYGPEPSGTHVDARGGWHDAADLLKYLLTSSNATAQLLLAWQLAKESASRSLGARTTWSWRW